MPYHSWLFFSAIKGPTRLWSQGSLLEGGEGARLGAGQTAVLAKRARAAKAKAHAKGLAAMLAQEAVQAQVTAPGAGEQGGQKRGQGRGEAPRR